jgi:hypothetical protein
MVAWNSTRFFMGAEAPGVVMLLLVQQVVSARRASCTQVEYPLDGLVAGFAYYES